MKDGPTAMLVLPMNNSQGYRVIGLWGSTGGPNDRPINGL
jgi:hypothetical protein